MRRTKKARPNGSDLLSHKGERAAQSSSFSGSQETGAALLWTPIRGNIAELPALCREGCCTLCVRGSLLVVQPSRHIKLNPFSSSHYFNKSSAGDKRPEKPREDEERRARTSRILSRTRSLSSRCSRAPTGSRRSAAPRCSRTT